MFHLRSMHLKYRTAVVTHVESFVNDLVNSEERLVSRVIERIRAKFHSVLQCNI